MDVSFSQAYQFGLWYDWYDSGVVSFAFFFILYNSEKADFGYVQAHPKAWLLKG